MKKELAVKDNRIYASVSLGKMLIDLRSGTYGCKFGSVENICRQFGINVNKMQDNVLEFSAPKLRMQMFVEKLHFSRTRYWA